MFLIRTALLFLTCLVAMAHAQSSNIDIQGADVHLSPVGGVEAPSIMTIGSAGTLFLNNSLSVQKLQIQSGGVLTHSAGAPDFELSVTENLTVTSGGKIDADGRGFPSGSGPGSGGFIIGTLATGGAGHAGTGGASSNGAPGGASYGLFTASNTLGSGGGLGASAQGGSGGGKLHITVGQTLHLDGSITARGVTGATLGGGGGSGGSIWITANNLMGNGLISVSGGSGHGGGGGGSGGYLKIDGDASGFTGDVGASGGSSGSGLTGLSGVPVGSDGTAGAVQGITAISPTSPGQPIATPNPTNSGFVLSWPPSIDNTLIASYSVLASSDGGVAFTGAGEPSGTSLSYAAPLEGTYLFKIRAIDPAGNVGTFSASSAPVVVDKTPPTAPGAPTIFPNPNMGNFNVSWSTASDLGGSGIKTHSLERSSDGGATFISLGQTTGTSFPQNSLAPGTYFYRVKATDAAGNIGILSVSSALVKVVTSPTISTTTLLQASMGVSYSSTLLASGGQPPYTFSTVSGTLPPGLALTSNGLISGVPSSPGTFSFTVHLTDMLSLASDTHVFSLAVIGNSPENLSIPPLSTGALPPAAIAQPFSFGFSAQGGTGPVTYSLTGGTLPVGLALNPTDGVLSGTPTTSGVFSFVVSVADATGQVASVFSTLIVGQSLPSAMIGVPYTSAVPLPPGTNPPTSFSVTAGQVPPGLALNSTSGLITGTATTSGTFVFVVTTETTSQIFQIAAGTGQPLFQPPVTILSTGSPGTPYTENIGLDSPLFLTGGILPPGLSVSGSVLVGTPTGLGGLFGFIVTSMNGTSGLYTLSIVGSGITPAALGYPYSALLAAGNPSGLYAVTGGQLPPGLTLNSLTGGLSGVAEQSGSFTFVVTNFGVGGTILGSVPVTIRVEIPRITHGQSRRRFPNCHAGTSGGSPRPLHPGILLAGLAILFLAATGRRARFTSAHL